MVSDINWTPKCHKIGPPIFIIGQKGLVVLIVKVNDQFKELKWMFKNIQGGSNLSIFGLLEEVEVDKISNHQMLIV